MKNLTELSERIHMIYQTLTPSSAWNKVNALLNDTVLLKPEITTCESCQKTVPLEWAIISGDEDTCYKCYSEMVSDYIRTWIPIEEFELKDGELYDVFSPDFGRVTEYIFKSGNRERFVSPGTMEWVIEKSEITHIMKRPADPEI